VLGPGRQYFLLWAKKIFSFRGYADFLFTSSAEPAVNRPGLGCACVVAAITSVENAARFSHPMDYAFG